jgi:hypothetical protein
MWIELMVFVQFFHHYLNSLRLLFCELFCESLWTLLWTLLLTIYRKVLDIWYSVWWNFALKLHCYWTFTVFFFRREFIFFYQTMWKFSQIMMREGIAGVVLLVPSNKKGHQNWISWAIHWVNKFELILYTFAHVRHQIFCKRPPKS